MTTTPKIVAFTRIVEKGCGDCGGWLHEIEFVLDEGHHLIIRDDTDEVSVYANTIKTDSLIREAVKLWTEYAFGCSHFPAKPVPKGLPRPDAFQAQNNCIWDGSGVKFSHIE